MDNGERERSNPTEARAQAQKLAFAPFSFHATLALRELGVLSALDEAGTEGKTLTRIVEETELTEYGVSVLLDFALNLDLVDKSGDRFTLGRVGRFVLHDDMTKINFNFTRDVCYEPLQYLAESVEENEPRGLEVFGPWDTIYEGLSKLPEPAKSSWFEFDHYHSDRTFDRVLPLVFDRSVDRLLDVGGNTGRWALKCLDYDSDVEVTIMDLPSQLEEARANIQSAGFDDRVRYRPTDLRTSSLQFPPGHDVIWLCQLLDCFSKQEISHILKRTREGMGTQTDLYIVELFPDRQDFEAATFSLNAISLYFTCIANGNSRMYRFDEFKSLVENADLKINEVIDLAKREHTVLRCSK